MPTARTRPVESVERFFQFALLGLITSAYFALAGSGYLDRPTLVLTFIGLLIRAAMVAGVLRFEIPAGTPSAVCRGCRATIYWIVTAAGRRMPVDADGVSHFATCPDHAKFRKKKT